MKIEWEDEVREELKDIFWPQLLVGTVFCFANYTIPKPMIKVYTGYIELSNGYINTIADKHEPVTILNATLTVSKQQ